MIKTYPVTEDTIIQERFSPLLGPIQKVNRANPRKSSSGYSTFVRFRLLLPLLFVADSRYGRRSTFDHPEYRQNQVSPFNLVHPPGNHTTVVASLEHRRMIQIDFNQKGSSRGSPRTTKRGSSRARHRDNQGSGRIEVLARRDSVYRQMGT